MSVFVGGISKCDPQLSNAEPVIVAGKPAPALEPLQDWAWQSCLATLACKTGTGKPASPQAWPASLGLAPMHEPRPDITQGSKLSAPQFQSALCPCGRSPWPCLVWLYDAAPRPGF